MMNRTDRHLLALDQGGHSSRALVFDETGGVVSRVSVAVSTRSDGDRVEQDPEELVASLRQAAESALGDGPCHAAGLATQRSSIVCWERDTGRALTPVISWQDRRAADRLEPLQASAERVGRLTGLRLSPHYGATKLAWCLEQVPAVRRAANRGNLAAGPLASFLLARLLDEKPCLADPANAARTLLYDRERYDWSPELLQLFGVPRAVLPDAVPNRHRFGHLATRVGAIPLTVCTGDQSAALFAAGAPAGGTVSVNAGTGAFLQQAVSAPARPGRLLAGLAWHGVATTVHTLEGTVNGAGAALSRVAREAGLDEKAMVERLTGALESDQEPPLFLNGVGGLGSPWWRSRFPSRFIGRGELPARLAGVLESVIFMARVNLEEMAGAGAPPRRLRITGGLSRLDGLCHRLASLTGLAVARPAHAEATAHGLAWLVAGRPARWQAGRDDTVFEPVTDAALARRFERWRRAMQRALG